MGANEIRTEQLARYFEKLLRQRFYGSLELQFENGRIYRVNKHHSIQGEELERLINS